MITVNFNLFFMVREIEVLCTNNNLRRSYPLGTTLNEIACDMKINLKFPICGAMVNHKVKQLTFEIVKPKTIKFFDYSHPDGRRMYIRSLAFVLYSAVTRRFPKTTLRIDHAISKGYYCELNGLDNDLSEEDIASIREEMTSIIAEDIPFVHHFIDSNEAARRFEEIGLHQKSCLFRDFGRLYAPVQTLNGHLNFFYGHLLPSTGYLKVFGIEKYFNGMLLRVPRQDITNTLEDAIPQKKLFDIFQEHKDWAQIMDIASVGSIIEYQKQGRSGEIIKISEALHEKKVAEIANMIHEREDKVHIILVAGPSSSGKTTFSKRLGVQLQVCGIHPHMLSLDNYFVDRDKTPKDEQGNYDFEALEAIDIECFNKDLIDLMDGKEIQVPRFDFNSGKRVYNAEKLKLNNGRNVLIIEGIHGMNPGLIPHINPENTFKIFISALTQISIDEHNHIPTTDNRLIRRIVRDYKYRGYSALETLRRWPSVNSGEEKHIFPYQENADIMFNSALLYELGVLKRYVEPLLDSVKENEPEHAEALRLLYFISYLPHIEEDEIPPTSIIREFLGGSTFKY